MGVMQVMRSLLMAQPHRESIVGTGVATFNTDFKAPMKLSVPMTPTQDLHGMPKPYPAGGSVNLIPDGTDTSNGYIAGYRLADDGSLVAATGWYTSEYFEIDETTTYTWSNRVNTNIGPSICFYDENKEFISGIAINSQYSHTFTPPTGTVYARSSQTSYTYQATNPTGAAFQLEVGSTATAYRRYSNICPINGFSSAFVAHTGKNLMSKNRTYYRVYPNGGKVTSAGTYRSYFPYVPPNKTIYFHSSRDGAVGYIGLATGTSTGSLVKDQKTMTYQDSWNGTSTKSYNRAIMSRADSGGIPDSVITSYQMMLSVNRQEAFAQPQINQYFAIAFTDPTTGDPLTVYAGTLTLNEDSSADLFVDQKSRTYSASEFEKGNFDKTHKYAWNGMHFLQFPKPTDSDKYGSYNDWAICSHGPRTTLPWAQITTAEINKIHTGVNDINWGFILSDERTFEEEQQLLNGLQVVYRLKNPITHHFDNVGQLKSFIGQNNVWTDLNGDPTVGYWKHG